MREIKFRAWDKDMHKMGQVKNIDFIGEDIELAEDEEWGKFCHWSYFELMQYTGLKDKNGKQIYEGDIVCWDFEKIPYAVYYNDKTSQFTTDKRWLFSSIECIEVIGNIYENPELL